MAALLGFYGVLLAMFVVDLCGPFGGRNWWLGLALVVAMPLWAVLGGFYSLTDVMWWEPSGLAGVTAGTGMIVLIYTARVMAGNERLFFRHRGSAALRL